MTQPKQTAVAQRPQAAPRGDLSTVAIDAKGLAEFKNLAEVEAACQRFANSGIVPEKLAGKPDACFAVVMLGAELGFSPWTSLRRIEFFSGKPTLPAELMAAVIQRQPDLEHYEIGESGKPYEDDYCVWIETRRRGYPTRRSSFSVIDAKDAELWGKATWKKYPRAMLRSRAVGEHSRTYWADRMNGLAPSEEYRDMEVGPERARNVTPQIHPDRMPHPAPVGPDPLLAGLLDAEVVEESVEAAIASVMDGPTADELDAERAAAVVETALTAEVVIDEVEAHRSKLGELSRALDARAAELAKERKLKSEKGVREAVRSHLLRYSGVSGTPTIEQIDKMIEAVPFATPEGVPAHD